MKEEDLNDDTIIGYSDDGKTIKVNDIFYINLYSTNIEMIPETIGKLTGLQNLFIKGDQFISLPESMENNSCRYF